MATAESDFRPLKIPKLDEKAVVESKRTTAYDRLRVWEPEKDEYVRQYLQFYCQYHQTKGFGIEWEKFDYFFNWCDPWDGAPRLDRNETNEEIIKDAALRAINKYNQDKDTNLVFVEFVSANYQFCSYLAYWVTFWARDMSSPCPESKLYQAKILMRAGVYQFPIFRVKPTDQEMMATPLRLRTPLPIHHDIDKPPIVFRRAGPGEDPVPGTPFVFSRDGWEFVESGSESEDDGDWDYN